MGFDVLGHLLEEGRGGTAAAGTRRDLWRKAPEAERLEHLLRHLHFLGPVPAWPRRERHADRIADALREQGRKRRGARNDPFRPHPRLRQAEVQGVVATAGWTPIFITQSVYALKLRR